MGAACSVDQHKLLIGNLSHLPRREQKLFTLSKYVLNKDDPFVGEIHEKLEVKIVDSDNIPECGPTPALTNDRSMHDEGTNVSCNDICVVADQSVEHTSRFCRDLHYGNVDSLFYVLLTIWPYYFSQTFSQWETLVKFTSFCPPSCCQRERTVLYLQLVDNFPEFITNFEIDLDSFSGVFDFLGLMKTFMEAFFDGLSVSQLPDINVFKSNWNIKTRLHHVTKQKQFFIRDFHKCLQRVKPKDGYCVVGITWTDLYPTEKLNFVLGEANFLSKTAAVCFGRFEPKTYDPSSHEDISELDGKLLWRLLKVLSHETCHLFGLQHCWYFQCAMNESNSMKMAASQPLFLCPVCLRKLQHKIQFDVLSRYKKLLRFFVDLCVRYPTEKFQHCVKWLEKCIAFIDCDDDLGTNVG